MAICSTSRDWSPPFPINTTLTNTDADATRAQQCLAVQAAARKVTASSVADKDGSLGTRYFEVTASPSPSSGRRSRPPASLACFPTDRPPALPAPRSWHNLRSLGFGLGLHCLVPSGHGHVSLALVAELLLSLQPFQGWPSTGWETRGSKDAGDLNSHTHSLYFFFFAHSLSSSDLAGNEIAAAGTWVGKRDISKISAPRQAWRSRYILTETCIWIERLAIHGACLLAPDTQAWRDLGPDLGPGEYVSHCTTNPSRPSSVVASTRDMMVSAGLDCLCSATYRCCRCA